MREAVQQSKRFVLIGFRKQEDKLLATPARRKISPRTILADGVRDGLQRFIAACMAELIIHLFEKSRYQA